MKMFKKVISAMLAILMALMLPMQVLAASNGPRYISEIVTVAAGSEKEAKTQLEAAGYKMVENSNLNATLKTGVYLGYKETDDKKNAITDIAAMNMLGKFSYSDYKQIMEDYKENIEAMIADIETFIEEFQLGYGNETKNALMAYSALNLFRNDEIGQQMGDYFLDYDFSEDANQEMTDMLMQANSDIVMSMIRALSFAGDPDDTTLVTRLSELGPDGLEEKYASTFPTHAAFERSMAKQYGTVADTLYKDWDYFYEYLCEVEKNIIASDANGELNVQEDAFEVSEEALDTEGVSDEVKELIEDLEDFTEAPEILDNTTDFGFYTLLAGTAFGDGTLLDYFKRPSAEIEKSELYVIADCMSDGQKNQVDFLGIKEILQSAFSAGEEIEDDASEAVEQYEELAGQIEAVSIFDGVDRSVFDNGVAFTSEAVNHESLTGDSWLDKLGHVTSYDAYWNKTTIVCWAATCGLAVTGLIATVVRSSALEKLPAAKTALENAQTKYLEEYDKILHRWDGGSPFYTQEENMAILDDMFPQYRNRLENCVNKYDSLQRTVKIAGVIKVASFVLLAVALVFDVYTIVNYFMQEKPGEEAIPHHIMATAATPYGEDYVYYQAARTLDGEAADVNNHEADTRTGWLVLYTTKDAKAGDPICANDIKVVVGSTDFDEDASFAHLFNEVGALNTTSAIYTGTNDTVSGTYILFNTDAASYTASAISGGNAALLAVGGLLLGGVLGSLITAQIVKKKEKAVA